MRQVAARQARAGGGKVVPTHLMASHHSPAPALPRLPGQDHGRVVIAGLARDSRPAAAALATSCSISDMLTPSRFKVSSLTDSIASNGSSCPDRLSLADRRAPDGRPRLLLELSWSPLVCDARDSARSPRRGFATSPLGDTWP